VPLQARPGDVVQYLTRTEASVGGELLDTASGKRVSFWAVKVNEVVTIQVTLDSRTIGVRLTSDELSVESSRNAAGGFSTLSTDERTVLQKLSGQLDADP
jgi:hypothetical protein